MCKNRLENLILPRNNKHEIDTTKIATRVNQDSETNEYKKKGYTTRLTVSIKIKIVHYNIL